MNKVDSARLMGFAMGKSARSDEPAGMQPIKPSDEKAIECLDLSHYPGNMISVPSGMKFVHYCPRCNHKTVLYGDRFCMDVIPMQVAVNASMQYAARHPALRRINELSREMEQNIKNLWNPDTSDINPELLALAEQAVERLRQANQN